MSALSLALVHHPVLDRRGLVVSTSLTTLDLHDIARSVRTYGADALYIVTPLRSQLTLAQTMMRYWRHGLGSEWNADRKEAMDLVETAGDLAEVRLRVEKRVGRAARLFATSARASSATVTVAALRSELEEDGPPVVLVLGTGAGLAAEALAACDGMLDPILGVEEYNHLSVRSAAAIYLDRLRGR